MQTAYPPDDAGKFIKRILSSDLNLPDGFAELCACDPLPLDKIAATFLDHCVKYSVYEKFDDALDLVRLAGERLEGNPAAMMQASFAAWARGSNSESEKWANQVIRLIPNHPAGYLRLGMALLTAQRFMESFLALSAGVVNASAINQIGMWLALAKQMALGPREVAFQKFGKNFKFRLTCFSTQAVESDASHLQGRFTEEEELLFLAEALVDCKSIMEVGALVGNHTVFLASMLQPETYLVVDADPRSIAETRANAELNRENFESTAFNFVNFALGGSSGQRVFISGNEVETRSLGELVPDVLDFIKIDVDGMEGDLLEPLAELMAPRNLKLFIEVETRFEQPYIEKMQSIGYIMRRRTSHGSYANLFFSK
jgi:FkbM family methyltransferase